MSAPCTAPSTADLNWADLPFRIVTVTRGSRVSSLTVACLDLDVGDPVELAPREACALALAVVLGHGPLEKRRVDVLEGVHADHRIEPAVAPARDHRDDAAARADVELGRPGAEGVPGNERGLADRDPERPHGAGSPEAAVLQTERAAAGARRNFRGLRPPVETERDVAAVAAPGDAHSTLPQSQEPTRHPGPIVRTERTPRPGLLADEGPQVDRDL